MSAFEMIVIDLLVGMEIMELIRTLPVIVRMLKKDWRRKKKDE